MRIVSVLLGMGFTNRESGPCGRDWEALEARTVRQICWPGRQRVASSVEVRIAKLLPLKLTFLGERLDSNQSRLVASVRNSMLDLTDGSEFP